MKPIFLFVFFICLMVDINAQKSKTNKVSWQSNLDSMYVNMKGHKRIQFIDEDKRGIKLVQAIIYSNGFVSAIIDYKDLKGNLLGSRYAMKAKRINAENFVTNKVFTDNPRNLKGLYEFPKIPSILVDKLKKLAELDGLINVLDGIKNLKSIADGLKNKVPNDLDALRDSPGKGRKTGYRSGVPWDVFNSNGQAKDTGSYPSNHPNGDGSITYRSTYHSADSSVMISVETTIYPWGRRETTTTQINDGGSRGGMMISVIHEISTKKADGSPDDYTRTDGSTDVATGERDQGTLTVENGSNVGVTRTVRYDGNGNEVSHYEGKVDVEYDAEGIPHEVNPSSTPSETSDRLSPAEEEKFWQSMPWIAELLYSNWAKEYAAKRERGNFSRPGVNEGKLNTRDTNPYRFSRNIVINCGEVNGCLPLGRDLNDPRQIWKNLINPPPLTH